MKRSTNSIHGLPAKAYINREFWETECNTVLADGWTFVGFVERTKMKITGSHSSSIFLGGSSRLNLFGLDISYFIAGGWFVANNGSLDTVDRVYRGPLQNGKRSDGFTIIYNLKYIVNNGFLFF